MDKNPWFSRHGETRSSISKIVCLSFGLLVSTACRYSAASAPKHATNPPVRHTSSQHTQIAAIPQYAPDIKHFLPKDWYLDPGLSAEGDLNGDGKVDHAFVISDSSETAFENGVVGNNQPLIIVAFALGDNKLQRACVASHILQEMFGPGIFTSSIKIVNGNLIIFQQGGNSHAVGSTETTFHFEHGRFALIKNKMVISESPSSEPEDSEQPGMTITEEYNARTGLLRHRLVVDEDLDNHTKPETLADYTLSSIIHGQAPSLSEWKWDDPVLATLMNEQDRFEKNDRKKQNAWFKRHKLAN